MYLLMRKAGDKLFLLVSRCAAAFVNFCFLKN